MVCLSRAGLFVSATLSTWCVSATEMMRSTKKDMKWCAEYIMSVGSDAEISKMLLEIRLAGVRGIVQ